MVNTHIATYQRIRADVQRVTQDESRALLPREIRVTSQILASDARNAKPIHPSAPPSQRYGGHQQGYE